VKKIVTTLACLLVASVAVAEEKVDNGGTPVILGTNLDCAGATPLTCGEVGSGANGTGGSVVNYGCTTLSYDGASEVVYEICVAADTFLQVDMNYTHTSGANDLDLFLLGSCSESDCIDYEAGVDGTEHVEANVTAGTYYVVVDGWNGLADGSPHTVSVTCDAPCDPVSVDASSWGSVKALYNK
jgi:hypothetical protein